MKLKYLDLPGFCVNVVEFYISGRPRYKFYKAKLSYISLMTYINNIYNEFPVVFFGSGHPQDLSAAIVGLLLCQVAERAAQVGSVDERRSTPNRKNGAFGMGKESSNPNHQFLKGYVIFNGG